MVPPPPGLAPQPGYPSVGPGYSAPQPGHPSNAPGYPAGTPGYPPGGFPPGAGHPAGPGFPPGGPAGPQRKSNGKLIAGIVIGIVVVLALCGGAAVTGLFFLHDKADDAGSVKAQIDGVVDYRATQPKILTQRHVTAEPAYTVRPPVGGDHDGTWQNCQGDVYAAKIGDANAVHSLEHGAVWITYTPNLPPAQIDKLAAKVKGNDYTLMSPYPGLDQPISLQAWGYQLKVDNADDERIDQFLTKYRIVASVEPGATCSNGTTATG